MSKLSRKLIEIEQVFDAMGYEVIYGQGLFQSGYCVVENQNKIVINKYFDTENRLNTLLLLMRDTPWESHVSQQELRIFILQKLELLPI